MQWQGIRTLEYFESQRAAVHLEQAALSITIVCLPIVTSATPHYVMQLCQGDGAGRWALLATLPWLACCAT